MHDFNKDAHYFVELYSCTDDGKLNLGETHLVECKLEPYEFSGFNYKLYVTPADPNLRDIERRRCYYTGKFEYWLETGHIIEKISASQHIEKIEWIKPLCGAAYVHGSAEIVVD